MTRSMSRATLLRLARLGWRISTFQVIGFTVCSIFTHGRLSVICVILCFEGLLSSTALGGVISVVNARETHELEMRRDTLLRQLSGSDDTLWWPDELN